MVPGQCDQDYPGRCYSSNDQLGNTQQNVASGAKAAAVGAVIGGTIGAAASAGCDVATGGVCAPANPAGIAGGAALGAAGGLALNQAWNQNVKPAADAVGNAVDQIVVHGNSLLSPRQTWVYELQNISGDILKYGITSNPIQERRYTKSQYKQWGAQMVILSEHDQRLSARTEEMGRCIAYVVSHGGALPPLSSTC